MGAKIVYNHKAIEKKWHDKYEIFYQKYNHVDDGNASKKILDLMIKITEA